MENMKAATRFQIPNPDCAVDTRGHRSLPVGQELHTCDAFRVAFQRPFQGAFLKVPDSNRAIRRSRNSDLRVFGNANRLYCASVPFKNRETFRSSQTPKPHVGVRAT